MTRPVDPTGGHLGPWTMTIPEVTGDELAYWVVDLAQRAGWRLDHHKLTLLERWRREIDEGPVYGTGRVREDADRAVLELLAARAVVWLNGQRADGRRFVLGDGLYLLAAGQPDSDATTTGRRWWAPYAAAVAQGRPEPPEPTHAAA